MKPKLVTTLILVKTVISTDCGTTSNQCLNGGICEYGSCLCPPGTSGIICEFIEPEVKCLTGHIEIHIQKNWATNYASVDDPSEFYMGLDNYNRTECQAFQHPKRNDMYVLRVDGLSSCGTEVDKTDDTHDYIYRNKVYANHFSKHQNRALPFPMPFIQRLNRLFSAVDWECQYQHKTDKLDEKFNYGTDIISTVEVNDLKVSIDAYKDPVFNTEESSPMDRAAIKAVSDGDLIHFVIHQSQISNRKFSVNNCIMSTHTGNRTNNLSIITYKESVLITDNCPFQNENGIRFSMIDENSPSANVMAFSVMFDRRFWIEDETVPEINPDVYIKCDISEDYSDTLEKCDLLKTTFSSDEAFFIESGPFQIKEFVDPYEMTFSSESDSEHSASDSKPMYNHLLEIVNRFDYSNQLEFYQELEIVLEMYERQTIKSLSSLTDLHLLTEEELKNENFATPSRDFEKQYHLMIVLGITVGVVLFLLILTPIVFACRRARMKKTKTPNTPVNGSKQPGNSGLDVDHDLFFVEFVDNIHDKVFTTSPRNAPLKRTSFDTKSIDISMEYWNKKKDDGLTTKTRSADIFDTSLTPKNKKASFLADIWDHKRHTIFKHINNARKRLDKEEAPAVPNTNNLVGHIIGMCIPASEESSVPYKLPGLIHQHRRQHV